MNSKINSISNHGETDTDMLLENSIYEALRERGWLIPETEEEIVRTLIEMETDPIDFPPELSTPPQIGGNRPNAADRLGHATRSEALHRARHSLHAQAVC